MSGSWSRLKDGWNKVDPFRDAEILGSLLLQKMQIDEAKKSPEQRALDMAMNFGTPLAIGSIKIPPNPQAPGFLKKMEEMAAKGAGYGGKFPTQAVPALEQFGHLAEKLPKGEKPLISSPEGFKPAAPILPAETTPIQQMADLSVGHGADPREIISTVETTPVSPLHQTPMQQMEGVALEAGAAAGLLAISGDKRSKNSDGEPEADQKQNRLAEPTPRPQPQEPSEEAFWDAVARLRDRRR